MGYYARVCLLNKGQMMQNSGNRQCQYSNFDHFCFQPPKNIRPLRYYYFSCFRLMQSDKLGFEGCLLLQSDLGSFKAWKYLKYFFKSQKWRRSRDVRWTLQLNKSQSNLGNRAQCSNFRISTHEEACGVAMGYYARVCLLNKGQMMQNSGNRQCQYSSSPPKNSQTFKTS